MKPMKEVLIGIKLCMLTAVKDSLRIVLSLNQENKSTQINLLEVCFKVKRAGKILF